MRNTLVTTLSASMLVLAALAAMPRNAQSQVIIIVGNGSAQPYYPPPYPLPRPYPYPQPYPHTGVVYGGGFYRGMATPHLITATTVATTAVVTGTPMATTTVAITHPTDTSA